MNNKYEKYLGKNSDSIVRLNQAIINRLNNIRSEFEASRKKQFKDFISKTGKILTDEQYDSMLRYTGNWLPRYSRIIKIPYNNIQMTQVIIHENNTNLK